MHVLVNFGFWLEVLLENKPKLHTFPLILPCFVFVVCQPFGSCATERWKIGFKSCKSMVDCFNSSLVSAPCSLLVYWIRNQGTAISIFIMQLYQYSFSCLAAILDSNQNGFLYILKAVEDKKLCLLHTHLFYSLTRHISSMVLIKITMFTTRSCFLSYRQITPLSAIFYL